MAAPELAHMVYFTLHDASQEKIDALIQACHKYLAGQDGITYFSVGGLNPDLARPVNDRDYQVGLHVVFKDRKAHDDYQVAPIHQVFIEEQKYNWKQVRVFDTDLR
jgi:hypothetical protein